MFLIKRIFAKIVALIIVKQIERSYKKAGKIQIKIFKDLMVPRRTTIPIGKTGKLFTFDEFNERFRYFFTVFVAHN